MTIDANLIQGFDYGVAVGVLVMTVALVVVFLSFERRR